MLARQAFAFDVLRRQVQVQFEPGRRGAAAAGQGEFVVIVGRLFGRFVVVVLDPAVEVQELGPGEEGLEAMQQQPVLALRLIALAPLGAEQPFLFCRRLPLVILIVAAIRGRRARRQRPPFGPQERWLKTPVAARCLQAVKRALWIPSQGGVVLRQVVLQVLLRRQQPSDHRVHGPFLARAAGQRRPHRQTGGRQAFVESAQSRTGLEQQVGQAMGTA